MKIIDENARTIGEKIRYMRDINQFAQKNVIVMLAERKGYTLPLSDTEFDRVKKSYQNWEYNKCAPKYSDICLLADMYRTTCDYFLDESIPAWQWKQEMILVKAVVPDKQDVVLVGTCLKYYVDNLKKAFLDKLEFKDVRKKNIKFIEVKTDMKVIEGKSVWLAKEKKI